MYTLPLHRRGGHLFVELGDELWLLDTGAPTSFGMSPAVAIAGERFNVDTRYLDLTAETLSRFVGVPCAGLLGADVLGRFDHIFDVRGRRLTVSLSGLSTSGHIVPIDDYMGVPIVTARVDGNDHRMFFDTGAPISYFQDGALIRFPSAGTISDFYPGVGAFETDTYEVPLSLGGVAFRLRCGSLPGLLGRTLLMAGTAGIVGNSILGNRIVGYFPRRRKMIL